MQKSRQLSLKECYSILNLDKGATLEDVKRAYRRRAFELHPDLHPGDADAGRQFQRLNEAYVALSQVLQTEEQKYAERPEKERARRKGQEAHKDRQEEARTERPDDKEDKDDKEEKEGSRRTAQAPPADESTQDTAGDSSGDKTEGRRKRAASAAYGREEVLRDLLNDPFARRVFEDIYSEVNRQAQEESAAPPPPPPPQDEPKAPVTPPAPPKPRKVQMEWGGHKLNLDFSKGLKGMVTGWLRHQIDDEQTIKMPAASLIPGARIRLQIRRGLSEELSTIEITLPQDFVVGKPVRLRGLGRKVGQWQGDLYLTLESK